MQLNDLHEAQLSNVTSTISFMVRDKVSHLRESIHSYYDCVPPLSPREGHDEIHTHIIPGLYGHGQEGIQHLMELAFGFMTNGTS